MNELVTSITTIALAIVGVAIVATLVSPKAKTSEVIGASGNAFSTSLLAALSPVTGHYPSTSAAYAGGGNFSFNL